MLRDILRDTPAYQQILWEGIEEGKKEGKQEGIEEGELLASRQMLLSIIEIHFPDAISLAQPQIERVKDFLVLQNALVKIYGMRTMGEVLQLLLELSKS